MKLSRIFLLAFLALSIAVVGCKKDDSTDDEIKDPKKELVNEWTTNEVAPALAEYFDSIYVEFRENQTYTVKAYNGDFEVLFEGTYVTSDGVEDIYNITLEQSVPSAVTSVGIFAIDGDKLTYEVAQIEPSVGLTAPTAEGGFGSTSGGAAGNIFVQTYNKIK